jgi:hypothetical protein
VAVGEPLVSGLAGAELPDGSAVDVGELASVVPGVGVPVASAPPEQAAMSATDNPAMRAIRRLGM